MQLLCYLVNYYQNKVFNNINENVDILSQELKKEIAIENTERNSILIRLKFYSSNKILNNVTVSKNINGKTREYFSHGYKNDSEIMDGIF